MAKAKQLKTIEDLKPDPMNVNKGTEHGAKVIDWSLTELGAGRSILADADGVVIAGNKTLQGAISHGLPIRVVETEGEELVVVQRKDLRLTGKGDERKRARQLAIADNRASEVGYVPDVTTLLEHIGSGVDVEALFDEAEVKALMDGLMPGGIGDGEAMDAEPQVDRATELNEKWKVKPGDLWLIGEHRLLCGDSTKAEDVARVMGGEKADMVFADPPYGIAIVATNGSVGGAKPFGSKGVRGSIGASNVVPVGTYAPIIGDETTDTAVASYELCASMFPAAAHVWWGGNYYANALPPSSCWIVWDKENTGNFADAELAWTNQETAVRIFKHQWNGMIKESERGQRRVHPTQKPVALAVWCFEQYGEKAGVVFDPFGGSGMSMVAAENKDKKARLIEMSADYCAVILERMATAFPDLTIRRAGKAHATKTQTN